MSVGRQGESSGREANPPYRSREPPHSDESERPVGMFDDPPVPTALHARELVRPGIQDEGGGRYTLLTRAERRTTLRAARRILLGRIGVDLPTVPL